MPYCTAAAVTARLPAVGLATDQAAMTTLINEGISWADAEIDSKLGARYVVPFTDVPAKVRHISADLAAAFVIDSSLSGGGEDDTKPLSVRLSERGWRSLKELATGAVLQGAATPQTTVAASPLAYHSAMGQRQILERFPVLQDQYTRHNRMQVNNPNSYPPDPPGYPPYPYPS